MELLAVDLLPPQQFGQTGEAAAHLQEFMGEQFVSRGTAADIHTETHAQERLEFPARLLRLLQPWGSVCRDEIQCLQGLFIQVRRLGLDHLDRHDTQRPAVDLGAVLLLLDHLGCHPVRCADHGGTLVLGLGELGTEAEISWKRLVSDFCSGWA